LTEEANMEKRISELKTKIKEALKQPERLSKEERLALLKEALALIEKLERKKLH